ncbi:Rossmann-like and DUF2520 domain-containing protein [Prolixibacter denitrificans]|uniref:Putative short-subunit dehydrogenase-like oxidoreductase (DUF2520 family) n=1 Tax=Prolixibacter denitrificans TaxID=1541063 RepID=A0A2P8C5L5_9BACT|nr:Rossmann-like and DUF2520 domain-containing protein [Prolixibacter denitrificans]PSK80252.1 putative short-subunit dehydrogenase-like oxidoreductase (DUF2520 family) [Prolixibacter denitrificans]GET23594.1 hypothetical protein JCM18694_38400 [Prolixibacter denitrificans]
MDIVLIGAGNLATRLGLRLVECNHRIVQVYSRTEESAAALADKLNTVWTTHPGEISPEGQLYLVSVSDKALEELLTQINLGGRLVAHTAGSLRMDVLKPFSANFGVFYPLQTFSKSRELDFSQIPVCIEANNSENIDILRKLGTSIFNDVREIDSAQRRQLHLSAVFVCNFVNHLYAIGEELLSEKEIDFNILKPLIAETAAKALEFSPKEVQTGPAVRFDRNVIDRHMDMLKEHPQWNNIYKLLSESIHQLHTK